LANLTLIIVFPEWQTLPFHLIWLALSLLYVWRKWSFAQAMVLLGVVGITTAAATAWGAFRLGSNHVEIVEVPLMGAMFVAMAVHATARQAAAERAHRLAEEMQEFVENVAHQLRTPLTIARGHVELIGAAHRGDQTGDDAEVVLDELDRLSRTADRLLLLASAQHPEFLVLSEVDPQELVERTAERWRGGVPARFWHVDAVAPGTVRVDEERLTGALDALLENSVKYTGEGDAIGVRVRAEGDRVTIEVWDTGVGIPADELSKVFERFYRAKDRPVVNGAGLGLPIVRAIVEAHGGTVEAQSVIERGTLFRIHLPSFDPGRPRSSELEPDPIPAL
jgi:signal transduction histidine kinase